MADIRCDFCADNLAAFIVGNIETGDQTFACPVDFARFGLGIAKAVLPQSELDAALSATTAPTAPESEGNGSQQPEPKRARRRASKRVTEPEATEGLEAPTTAAEDG
jgi:hypothetical protein